MQVRISRRLIFAAIGVVGTLLVAGCNTFVGTTIRYRISVEVETPQGVKSGSSVWQVTVRDSGPLSNSAINYDIRGEAVAVDLPSGVLFALLNSQHFGPDLPAYIVQGRVADVANADGRGTNWRTQEEWPKLERERPTFILPKRDYPTLVRFRAIRDPKSVEAVDPGDLAKSFGPGVRLRRITITVTDEPVTTGIEKRLGWLGTHPEPSLNPSHGPMDFSLPATLHNGDFRNGAGQ